MRTVASIEIAHPKEKLDYEVKNSTKKKPMFDKTRDNALIMGEEKCFLILSQVHLYLKKLVHFCDNYFNWVGNC